MDTPVERAEFEEFGKRLDEENHRQNERLRILEDNVRQIGTLTSAVDRLATSMEGMVKEQEKQGKRLEVLEGRDGEKWRQAVGYAVTAVIGIILGYIFTRIGL